MRTRMSLLLGVAVITGCSSGSSGGGSPGAVDGGTTDGGSKALSDSGPSKGDATGSADGATILVDGGAPSDGSTTAADAVAPPSPPAAAVAAGYTTNTFSSTFAKAGVDLGNTQKSGFEWYLGQFFGGAATPPSDLTFNADGTLNLDGAGTSSNAGINTASPASNAAGWVGVAFGGGAYFEATFKFDPKDTINAGGNGWPAWWAMAIEHLAGLATQQWQGQPSGYAHFIETDFFEYDVWSFAPHTQYGGATHDWYGVWNQTCGTGIYCNVSNAGGGGTSFSDFVVQTPSTTDYTEFHRFGYLWVPATATTKGSATYYFDGQPTNDTIDWSQYTGSEPPPPGTAPWTFGVLDGQHVALILGTGANEPMTLQSVTVWQKSAAQNLAE